MELFGTAHDGVHGARVDAFYAAYTGFFIYDGQQVFRRGRGGVPVWFSQQVLKLSDCRVTAGGT